jgi:hypothetical protein
MPFLTSDLGSRTTISTSWWGCPEATPRGDCKAAYNATPTIDYAVRTVELMIERYGGDPKRVMVTGWSRGAIACGAIGLANDRIAKLWRVFMPYAHQDGDAGASTTVDTGNWNTKQLVREQYARLDSRPVLNIAECNVATEIERAWLKDNNLTTLGGGLNVTRRCWSAHRRPTSERQG